jgi:chemotaxis protein MotA
MDLATIVGMIVGMILILGSIVMGGSLTAFINIPSLLVVVGGTMASALINFPLDKVMGVVSITKKTLLFGLTPPADEIARMVKLAKVARSEGLLALENHLDDMNDEFLRKGIQQVVDGTEPDVLREVMSIELEQIQARHSVGKNMFDAMGAAAPAFGMIGTLIGLVQMLGNLSDPSGIGAGMAVALLTTLYGSILANLVFIPLAGKLDMRSKEEVISKQLIIEGVVAIQAGLNPRLVEEKLKSFVAPKTREHFEAVKQAA